MADAALEKPIDIAPIVKAFKGRATAASTLLARANRKLIAKHRGSQSIGGWKLNVTVLFHQLPVDERNQWEAQPKVLKEKRKQEQHDHFE